VRYSGEDQQDLRDDPAGVDRVTALVPPGEEEVAVPDVGDEEEAESQQQQSQRPRRAPVRVAQKE